MALKLIPDTTLVRQYDNTFKFIDVRDRYVDDLLHEYRDVYVGLIDDVLGTQYSMDLRKGDAFHILVPNLVNSWVLSNMVLGAPTLNVERSFYRPILKGFESIKLCKRNQHPSHPVDASEAEDVIASNLKHGQLGNCLFTVNGFFVRSVLGATDARLIGAARLMYRNGDTSCGVMHMPTTVAYTEIDAATAQFTADGQLYVPVPDSGDTPAIVIAGRLFICGIDKELRRGGADYALFTFDNTFMLDWVVRYAPLFYPDVVLDLIDPVALNSEAFKRKLLESEYCFNVTLGGNGLYVEDTAVEKHWYRERRVQNYKNTDDFYGMVKDANGRVVDYWGVYLDVANVLYFTTDEWDTGGKFHAHTTAYMGQTAITNKRNLKRKRTYNAATSRVFYKRS